jgi:RHS repeat-associated protein
VNTAGYTYDSLGRTTTSPASDTADAGGGVLTSAYYVTDLIRSLSQGGQTTTYVLDVVGNRFRGWADSDGTTTTTKTNHYNGDGDNPVWTSEGATEMTRPVSGIAGMVAICSNVTGLIWQLVNLHGDIVGGLAGSGPGLAFAGDFGESGQPRNPADVGARRYGWLGNAQRAADTPGGELLMGARVYSPTTQRFFSTDPIYNGSANAYDYAAGDAVNSVDLSGTFRCWTFNRSSRRWYYWYGLLGGYRYDFDFACSFSHYELFLMLLLGGFLMFVGGVIATLGGVGWGIALMAVGFIIDTLVAHYWWFCSGQRGAVWVGHVRVWRWYETRYSWGYAWYRYWYCR